MCVCDSEIVVDCRLSGGEKMDIAPLDSSVGTEAVKGRREDAILFSPVEANRDLTG